MPNRATVSRMPTHVLVAGLLAALVFTWSRAEAATPSSGTITGGSVSWDFTPVVGGTPLAVGTLDTCPLLLCDNYDLRVELPVPAAIFYQTMTARPTFQDTWASTPPNAADLYATGPNGAHHGPGSPNAISIGPGEEDLTITDPAEGVWHVRSLASLA